MRRLLLCLIDDEKRIWSDRVTEQILFMNDWIQFMWMAYETAIHK